MVTTTKILMKIVLTTSLFIKSFGEIISSSEESQEDFHDTDTESSLSLLYRDNLDKLKIPAPATSRIEEHKTEEPYVLFPSSQDYNIEISDMIEKLNTTTDKHLTKKFEHIEIKSVKPEDNTEGNLTLHIKSIIENSFPQAPEQENLKFLTIKDNLSLSVSTTENSTLNEKEKKLMSPDSDIKILNEAGGKIVEMSSDDSTEQFQDRKLPRETVNWTSCEEFLNGSTLDINRTVGTDWKMFAGWVFIEHANWTDRQVNFIKNSFTIRLPPKEDIQKFKNVELVMEDEFMSGFMWRQNNISGLYHYRPLPVNTTFEIADALNLSIALRLSELGHLGFKDCHTRVLLLAARRESFPSTDIEALEAAALFNMTTDPNFVQYHEGPVLVWKLIRAIKLVF